VVHLLVRDRGVQEDAIGYAELMHTVGDERPSVVRMKDEAEPLVFGAGG
jgi:hypothetical protein